MSSRQSKLRLNRKPGQSRNLKRNLATSFLLYESVRTTKNRAKAIQPIVDRLINIGKKKNAPTAIRMINTVVTDKNACKKIMEVYKERFKNRESGFSTMTPAGYRKGDCAQMVDLEMIDGDLATKQSSSDKKS